MAASPHGGVIEDGERRSDASLRFLAEASTALAASLDYETTLRNVARLAVPAMADWAVIDVVAADGSLQRVAVAHVDAAKLSLAHEIEKRRPLRRDDPYGPAKVIRTGEPEVTYEVSDAEIDASVPDEEMREIIRSLGLRSSMCVPLRGRDGVIGALSLVFADSGRRYGPSDLELAHELARRIAIALENAHLYGALEIERAAADAAEKRALFLAEASEALASSLDYEATLPKVVKLVVPRIADMAGVYVLDPDGAIRQVAAAHVDAEVEATLWELHALTPLHVDQDRALPSVIRSGEAQLHAEVSEDLLAKWAQSERAEEIVAAIGVRSYMVVPMSVRGRVLGAIAMSTSVSGRRLSERDFELAQELARHVAAALENAQLYADAREASRLKDEFLATISHELRTPLNAILGWASILSSRAGLPETVQRGLAVIERNARAQARLVDDVLDVSRIVSGKMRLRREHLDVGAAIRAALESVSPTASAGGIELRTEIEPALGTILGDPDRVQQIVWNLLSNAAKFTPAGGHVVVSAKRAGSYVVIEVADDGVGIAPEFLPFVFERFRQADSSTTRRHGGLGLGLAIARHLTELHGGTIEVRSEGPGRGTTFRVRLPIRGSEEALAGAPAAAGESDAYPPLDGVRVLLCDDDEEAREMLSEILDHAGAHVAVCGSVAEALDAIDATVPDVLISDIAMPGEDGYALIRKLRHRSPEHGGNLPAVALTAHASAADRRRALAAGFHQHVAKPVDPEDLLVVVANLAGRFQSAPTS